MTVGELFDDRLEFAVMYAAPRHLIFDFGLMTQPWQAEALAGTIDEREAAFGPDRWPAVVLSNHDQPRHATRYARGAGRDAVAKAAAVLLLTLRGTPFMYYGEEIALGDIKVPRREIVDPPARRYWPLPLWWNRDGCRAPMPWSGGPNGGFTTGRPWLRMAPDFATRNVAEPGGRPGFGPGRLPSAAGRATDPAGAPEPAPSGGSSGLATTCSPTAATRPARPSWWRSTSAPRRSRWR